MRLPAFRGVIDRRILANYRLDPEALRRVLPDPFEPWTVDGYGVGGICLIRLREMRPPLVPARFGMASENAAHRIAVEFDHGGERRRGVYVPRRDTTSWLQTIAGSRLFAGEYHHASFDVVEGGGHYAVEMASDDGAAHVRVMGAAAADLPADSVFSTLDEASAFFRDGSLGYSPGTGGDFEGVELDTDEWHVEAMAVDDIASSFFEGSLFPDEAVTFDCALLMRNIGHTWRQRESLCVPSA